MQNVFLASVFKSTLALLLLALSACALTDKVLPQADFNTFVVKGDAAAHDGQWAKAADWYEQAIMMHPEALDIRMKQAQAYQYDGKYAQAFNTYQLVIDAKVPATAANEQLKKQAKSQQKKFGFKMEPQVIETAPVNHDLAKPNEAQTKAGQKPATKSGATETKIVTVNADTTPAPPIDEKKAVSLDANKAVLDEMAAWREAWINKRLSAYFAHYVEDFSGEAKSAKEWRQQRQSKIASAKSIKITLSDIKVRVISDVHVEVTFKQVYQSGTFKDAGYKVMQFEKLGERWLIKQERFS